MHAPEPVCFGSEGDLQGFRKVLSELSKCSCTNGKSLASRIDGGTSCVHHILRLGRLGDEVAKHVFKNKQVFNTGRTEKVTLHICRRGRAFSIRGRANLWLPVPTGRAQGSRLSMPLSTGRRPRSQVHGVGFQDRWVRLEVQHVLGKVSNEECLIGVLQVVALVSLQVRVLLRRILTVPLPVSDLAAVAAASSFLKLSYGDRIRARSKWSVPDGSSIISSWRWSLSVATGQFSGLFIFDRLGVGLLLLHVGGEDLGSLTFTKDCVTVGVVLKVHDALLKFIDLLLVLVVLLDVIILDVVSLELRERVDLVLLLISSQLCS